MDERELDMILENHRHWLCRDRNGWEKMRANLTGEILDNNDLRRANLAGANLMDADLSGSDLRGADLCWANLMYADLRLTDLSNANLSGANLMYASLRGANLSGANVMETNLHCADLMNAINIPKVLAASCMACPQEGSFIGFKACDDYIIKIKIPEDAKRSSATSRKCRCSKALVLSITNKHGKEIDSIINENYVRTIYIVGEMVYPDSFDENRWNECSHGIHFFMTKEEALEYI